MEVQMQDSKMADSAGDLATMISADAEVDWIFGTEGHFEAGGSHRPSEVEDAVRAWLEATDWENSSTLWFTGYAIPLDPSTGASDGTHRVRVSVTLHPEPPKCATGQEHDWRSPIEIVGGIAENPGVWGHGGGVRIHEVCANCGVHRHTDTWATNPETGEQGVESIAYEDADDETTDWVAELQVP